MPPPPRKRNLLVYWTCVLVSTWSLQVTAQVSTAFAGEYPVADLQVSFSPRGDTLEQLVSAIRSARTRIDVAVFLLGHDVLLAELCEASMHRKLTVRVITDATMNTPAQRPVLERLANAGIEVLVMDPPVKNSRMHMKNLVVDGETVITGAANWTRQAFEANLEDTVLIRSPELACAYLQEYDAVADTSEVMLTYSDGKDTVFSKSTKNDISRASPKRGELTAPRVERIGDCRKVYSFFMPDEEGLRLLKSQIKDAESQLDIGMYLLTDPEMADAVAAKAKSCPVRILVDHGMTEPAASGYLKQLVEAGCKVRVFGADRENLHLKALVVDNRYVWTGSANWTAGALHRNVEDLLCFDSPSMAHAYRRFLDMAEPFCTPWEPVAGVAERAEGMETALPLPPTGPRTDYTPPTRRNLGALETPARVKYLRDEEYLPALLRLIQTAKQSLIGTIYVFSEQKSEAPCQEQVVKALVQAARRGVYVYLVLHTPDEATDRLNEHHSNWAERLRKEGLDVRLSHPTISMHAKLLVADQSKILLGSHNWSEGSLSGRRVYESSVLVVLEQPDVRMAELILDLPVISDMRNRELWEAERDRIRVLSRVKSGEKDDLLEEWGIEP